MESGKENFCNESSESLKTSSLSPLSCRLNSSTLTLSSTKPMIIDNKTNISLAWHNLRYESSDSSRHWFYSFFSKPKTILNRLNGSIEYHQLTAFLGPSGSGKTTLLNCLNGVKCYGLTRDSELYLNQLENRQPLIGFIEQHVHETIIGKLTVKEIFRFAFLFKNGFSQRGRISAHINSVMKDLILDSSILDNPFENCSGGEQKRIAIAQELMSLIPPSFLFVDEPTTGLDSTAALLVMRCLRNLANQYKMSITVSIHTPNEEIVSLFDKLYILAKGGVCIYSGPPKLLRQSLMQLNENEEKEERQSTSSDCSSVTSIDERRLPIEQFLKIACNENDPRVNRLAELTLESEHENIIPHLNQMDFLDWGVPKRLKAFSMEHFLLQLYRLFRIVFVADFVTILGLILTYIIIYVSLLFLFDKNMLSANGCYSLADGDNATCLERLDDNALLETYLNYQSMCMMAAGFSMVGLAALSFTPFLRVFRNEHRNRWYSLGTFLWSYSFVRFIEMSIYTLVITILVYFPSGHHLVDFSPSRQQSLTFVELLQEMNWNRFGHFLGLFWLNHFYMQSIGQMVAVIFVDQAEVALICSYVFYNFMCILNGQLVILEHMNNPFVIKIANFLASNVISKGLLWSIYGLDRCDREEQISLILQKYDVDPTTVYINLTWVLTNSLILRMAIIIIMLIRFNLTWQFLPKVQNSGDIKLKQEFKNVEEPKGFGRISPVLPRRIKEDNELKFEEFSRDKVIVAWRNLTVFASNSIHEIRSVENEVKTKKILRDLNGQFCFGTMNALMGASGAGKTSLLKVLNGRSKTRISDETRIYLSRFTPTRTCYITQEVSGHLLPGLTAKQSLIYASRLKNGFDSIGLSVDHEQVALNLLDELDLKTTENNMVQNCSGGERKRLALALELVSMRLPNLICIDEPTSGLDSNSSEVVIGCLREFVKRHNVTIIASIHQPNIDLMNMFDQIYVLARGGVCIFSGPSQGIRKHLKHLKNVETDSSQPKYCPLPIEELIKYSCLNHLDSSVKTLVAKNDLKMSVDEEQFQNQVRQVVDGIPRNRTRFRLSALPILLSRYITYIRGYLWHKWLMYLAIYSLYALILRYLFDPRIVLTDGCISLEDDFNQTSCNRSQEKIDEEINLKMNFNYNMFAFNLFIIMVMLQSGLSFTKEIIFFKNEHRNGWYSSGIFYLSQFISESFFITLVVAFYLWIVDIFEPIRPGIYIWMFFLFNLGVQATIGLSKLLAILANGNSMLALAYINIAYTMMLMTGNLLSRLKKLHYIIQFISNFSVNRFINESFILLQYGFDRCGPKQIQSVLYSLNIENDHHFYYCIRMLVILMLSYHIIALLLLIFRSNPIENRRHRADKLMRFHQEQLLNAKSNVTIPGLTSHNDFCVKIIQT